MSSVRNVSKVAAAVRVPTFLVMRATFSPNKDTKIAEDDVAKFQQPMDAELYHDIYGQATSGFQKSDGDGSLTEFLSAAHANWVRCETQVNKAFL